MKLTWKLISLLALVGAMTFSCSKGNTKPAYKFKKSAGDGVAAQFGNIKITEKELLNGIESDIYDAESKIFDIKFNKLKSLILEKMMEADPKKKGLTNDQYMDKYIASKAKVSKAQIEAFIKEKNIPKEHVTPQIKERINNYLLIEAKKSAVDVWIASKSKNSPIDVFIQKPRRPSFDVKAGDAPFAGGKDAKVTIVEFSDFQCPFCAKAATIVQDLKKKYGKKIKIAFKQFPLPFHSQAKIAANAALCANEQKVDFFWKMHDAMFADQSKLSADDLKNLGKKLGVDSSKFDACIDSNKYAAKVAATIEEGKAIGVKSTPTFYINGQLINGAQPLEVFSQIIDEELN